MKVKMLKTVKADFEFLAHPRLVCVSGLEYNVKVNPYGAVTAITEYGELGLKPNEFEWVNSKQDFHLALTKACKTILRFGDPLTQGMDIDSLRELYLNDKV